MIINDKMQKLCLYGNSLRDRKINSGVFACIFRIPYSEILQVAPYAVFSLTPFRIFTKASGNLAWTLSAIAFGISL